MYFSPGATNQFITHRGILIPGVPGLLIDSYITPQKQVAEYNAGVRQGTTNTALIFKSNVAANYRP